MMDEPAAAPQRERLDLPRRRADFLKPGPEGMVWPGLAALTFGLVFLAASLGVFGEGTSEDETPIWLLGAFGYTAAMVGFYAAGGSLKSRWKKRKVRRGRAKHPDEPWRWDHRWNRRGATDEGLAHIFLAAIGLTVVASFLALFNYAAFDSWRLDFESLRNFLGFGVIALAGVAVVLAGYGYLVLELVRHLRHRRGAVRFAQFPFFLGESVALTLTRRGWRSLSELEVTLRCVEESYDGAFQLYAYTTRVKSSRRSARIELRFPLPSGAYETHLTDWPFRYWELRVRGTAARSGYDALFLLPVYARRE